MRRPALHLAAVLLLLFAGGCSQQNGEGGGLQRVTDYFSSEVKDLDSQIQDLQRELAPLPAILPNQQTERIGYHSLPSDPKAPRNPARPDIRTIRLDLGSKQPIDSIVLVPAEYAFGPDNAGEGYGFPVRFRVEVSDDLSFEEDLRVVHEDTGRDFPNPRRMPVVIPVEGQEVRYVRLTATSLWTYGGRSLLALGEIMVLQGGRNIAAGLPPESLKATNYGQDDSDETPPTWRLRYLIDGQSLLGAPQGISPSPTSGYQSLHQSRRDSPQWVMIDLGREAPLNEIRLIPARAREFSARRGFGFPRRFRVEIAPESDTTFSQPTQVEDSENRYDFANTRENPVSIRVPGTPARYVKITAYSLGQRLDDFVFALSEVQVFSGGENIALGASVSAQNTFESNLWSTKFLTDGFSSQRDLLPWPDFVSGLQKRRLIEISRGELRGRRREATDATVRTAVRWTIIVIGAAVVTSVILLWRHRIARRRELSALRRRLAQDIHDEIGSGLGTISLLSQMGCGNESHSGDAREEFTEIHRLSRTVTESLRDIVWFIRPESRTVGDLAQRLRETADSMLAGIPHSFDADCPSLRRELRLEHKRQVLMFFKEALHNVIRHSNATRAEVHISGDEKCFRLLVKDNGCGFDPASPSTGAGMTGMKQRAKTLGGRLLIETAPGNGTSLLLEVPWRSSRKTAAP